MKATIDAAGKCTIRLAAADNALVTNPTLSERHKIIIAVGTADTPPSVIFQEVEFYVEKVNMPPEPEE
jgi:hypothetical protein